MSIIRPGDAEMHYTGGSHRWTAPTEEGQQSWEEQIRAHVADHRRGDHGPPMTNTRLQSR